MSRSRKATKVKGKLPAKKARTAVKRRAVPERMRSDRRLEGRPDAGESVTDRLRDNARLQVGDPVSVAAAPKMNNQLTRSDPPPSSAGRRGIGA